MQTKFISVLSGDNQILVRVEICDSLEEAINKYSEKKILEVTQNWEAREARRLLKNPCNKA